ncbi:MAG: YhbY family RNA-binding protein [Acidobacteria bacterium]|nr:MAG: YhbY family RNA-binding protein [Acidobacteriota bacterium]
MVELSGKQRRYLRGLAHGLRPAVMVGRAGLTPALIDGVEEALARHELIKIKFVEHKGRKAELVAELEARLDCAVAGIVGHVAILYRPATEAEERRIALPA